MTPSGAAQFKVKRVAVAWKDSREARRAVSDALPFLQRADTVLLVEVCDKEDTASVERRLADVAAWLLRHGVKATASVTAATPNSVDAEQFLGLAERHKADLIVAGGYGHSRLGEWVFGGFTRALLAQSARAVLFSH